MTRHLSHSLQAACVMASRELHEHEALVRALAHKDHNSGRLRI